MMNTVLWILQAILAIKLVSVAFTHGVRPEPSKMQRGAERFGAATRPILTLVSLCALLIAIGLLLPAARSDLPWLTPLSAALLAAMMLMAIAFHLRCRERYTAVVGVILFAMAAFVAYGRWVLAPF